MAKITVNFEKCKGCGLCTTACPKKIVELQGYFTAVCIDDDACVGCKSCAVMCPDCCIVVER